LQVLHCGLSREAAERAERRSKKYMPKNLDNAGLYINHRNNLVFEGTSAAPSASESSERSCVKYKLKTGVHISITEP